MKGDPSAASNWFALFLIDELKNHDMALDWFAEPAALLSKEYFEERYVSWEAEPALAADESSADFQVGCVAGFQTGPPALITRDPPLFPAQTS